LDDAAVNKTTTTLNPASARPEVSRQEQWAEFRSVFPIYLALAKQLEIAIPFPQETRNLPEKPPLELFKQVQNWLDSLDSRVLVHQLRHLLQQTTLNASESGLRALIQRHLRKPSKTNIDRDKIDFLLVQYFALCAPAKIYHKQIELEDTAAVMKPVLGETGTTPLSWCEPLEKMITSLRGFRSLRDMLKTNFIAEGRKVKEAAGGMFYDSSALISFIRFNFLLRRTMIELMHADLIAIRTGLQQLEAAGTRTLDCRQSGFAASESVAKIRQFADEWKQPFQKDYTERAVNETWDKLLNLRTDVEKSLQQLTAKSGAPAASRAPAPAAKSAAPPSKVAAKQAKVPEPAAEPEPDPVLDFENCLEQIWEQLIATPPMRGRSMTTVKIGRARILMSSWEVTAFVSEDSSAADDLRRAVVARAMVTAAIEAAKETGNATGLDRALSVARVEVSRLQERVDVAKQAKDTEAAVNLGISTKRLLSALDEAEKL
jgi:hypothetical protein